MKSIDPRSSTAELMFELLEPATAPTKLTRLLAGWEVGRGQQSHATRPRVHWGDQYLLDYSGLF